MLIGFKRKLVADIKKKGFFYLSVMNFKEHFFFSLKQKAQTSEDKKAGQKGILQ